MDQETSASILKFGPFELDLLRETLTKGTEQLAIQRQPLAVLTYLALNSERLVTRDELYQHIWGHVSVELDQGLNFCVHEIRQVLGDDFRSPKFVQTAPRQGYRFLPLVEPVSVPAGNTSASRWRRTLALAFGITAMAAVAALIFGNAAEGEATGVARHVHEILTSNPAAREAYSTGNLYLRRNLLREDLAEAVRHFRNAIAYDSNFAQAWAKLGIARLSFMWEFGASGQFALAELAVERAAELKPDLPETHLALGYLRYYGYRDYDAALINLLRAESLASNDPDILIPIGYVLRRQGHWNAALEYFHRAAAIDAASFELQFALATTYQQMRQYDQAEIFHDRAIALEPERYFSHRLKALLRLARDGDPEGALDVLNEWRTFRPEMILISPVLSRTLATHFAVEARDWSMEQAPIDSATFYLNKGQLLATVGDSAAAVVLFDSARVVFENRGVGRTQDFAGAIGFAGMQLSLAYAALDRKDEALDLAERIIATPEVVADHYSGPRALVTFAEVLVAIGEHERAKIALERLLEIPSWISRELLSVDPIWAAAGMNN